MKPRLTYDGTIFDKDEDFTSVNLEHELQVDINSYVWGTHCYDMHCI